MPWIQTPEQSNIMISWQYINFAKYKWTYNKDHSIQQLNTCFLLFRCTISDRNSLSARMSLLFTMWYMWPARLLRTRSSNCSYVSSTCCSSGWKPESSLQRFINHKPHCFQLRPWKSPVHHPSPNPEPSQYNSLILSIHPAQCFPNGFLKSKNVFCKQSSVCVCVCVCERAHERVRMCIHKTNNNSHTYGILVFKLHFSYTRNILFPDICN